MVQVFGLPISGSMVECPWDIDGSGSTYIWGYMDAEFKEGMTRKETEDFCITAISLAMARDGSSGGMVRILKEERIKFQWGQLCTPNLPPAYDSKY